MSTKVVAIASDTTGLNLALTGIRVEEIADPKEAEKRCDDLIEDGLDVLIVDERLREQFSDRMREKLFRHKGLPLLVNCPVFDKEDSEVDAYLSSVIRPAVGFEIRLT